MKGYAITILITAVAVVVGLIVYDKFVSDKVNSLEID